VSFNADGLYVDHTAEDDAPHCARCNDVLNHRRDGIHQIGDVIVCRDCWVDAFMVGIGANQEPAAL
jgi:hypothetical protein